MQEYTIQRKSDVPLTFVGELIAEVSTEGDGNERWEETRVWRTDGATSTRWVVQRVGKSHRPGERDVPAVWKCKTPRDVRFALRRNDRSNPDRWYMTDSALEVLEEAATVDDRLSEAMVERI